MKGINIDNMRIRPYPGGVVLIDTIIPCDEGKLVATSDTFKGERFTWVGRFIYNSYVILE